MLTLLDRIKPRRGLITAIALEAGVTHGAVSQWLRTRIPAERVLVVERVTGIDRADIRPDLYPPEAAGCEELAVGSSRTPIAIDCSSSADVLASSIEEAAQ